MTGDQGINDRDPWRRTSCGHPAEVEPVIAGTTTPEARPAAATPAIAERTPSQKVA